MDSIITDLEKQKLRYILACYDGGIMQHHFNPYKHSLETGVLLTDDSFKAIFDFVSQMSGLKDNNLGFRELIIKNVLKFSTKSKYAVWVTESSEKKIMYKTTSQIKSGKYKVPPLLWVLKKNELYIYALKSANKITMQTKIYYAPFYNVNSTGKICMGNAYFNENHTDYAKIISDVEHKFFNSFFTHSQNQELTVNFVKYCNEIVNKNEFNLKYLLDTKLTLKQIIDGN